MITVHQIGRTFVKATRFTNPETVEVLASGIRGDRDFFLLESSGSFEHPRAAPRCCGSRHLLFDARMRDRWRETDAQRRFSA